MKNNLPKKSILWYMVIAIFYKKKSITINFSQTLFGKVITIFQKLFKISLPSFIVIRFSPKNNHFMVNVLPQIPKKYTMAITILLPFHYHKILKMWNKKAILS